MLAGLVSLPEGQAFGIFGERRVRRACPLLLVTNPMVGVERPIGGRIVRPRAVTAIRTTPVRNALHLGVRRHERRTLRWRETDSNPRSPARGDVFEASLSLLRHLPLRRRDRLVRERDRGFASPFLQR